MLKAFKFGLRDQCSQESSSGLLGRHRSDFCFVLLEQTRPLYAGVAKHNAASIRVLQKCGFVIDDAPSEDDAATHLLLKLDAKL